MVRCLLEGRVLVFVLELTIDEIGDQLSFFFACELFIESSVSGEN